MSIMQRCEKCRFIVKVTASSCPHCGKGLPRSPMDRTIVLRKKIAGRTHTKIARGLSMLQVEKMFAEWADSLIAPKAVDDVTSTMREIFDSYLHRLESEGRGYHKKVRLFFERMIDAWGDIEPDRLNVFMVRSFQTELRAKGASPAYVDRHLAMGKAAWNHALPDTPNPFKRVKLFRPDNRLTRWLTEEEQEELLEAARKCRKGAKNMEAIIIVAINTGLRKQNVLRLHTSETDFENRTITIRQKRDLLHSLPMNSIVERTLRKIHPGEGYYFTSHRNSGRPLTRIEGSFAQVKEAAGITRPFRFHDLRHHCATMILRKTGNLALTAKILGHRQIETTLRYAHVIDGDMRAAMETGYPEGYPTEEATTQPIEITSKKT